VIDFRSDNTHGASPEMFEALQRAAAGNATSYGDDHLTARLRERCRDLFETDVDLFPVVTGTAANALALAAMTPPDGTILCHANAHIIHDELGAAGFFTGGATLLPLPGDDGKLDPETIAAAPPASCLSIANATEAGTVYTPAHLASLGEAARRHNLGVHLDGARFTNALASLGCTPADLTWRAGVDVLSFGATKNGCLAAELLVVFRRELAAAIAPLWQRSGHRLSKTRFLAAQLEAYLDHDLWLRNARHANACARRIAEGVTEIDGVAIVRPVDANVVFLRLDAHIAEALETAGILFYDWPLFGPDVYRFVSGFTTTDEDITRLLATITP
jgi:threonine aldolase